MFITRRFILLIAVCLCCQRMYAQPTDSILNKIQAGADEILLKPLIVINNINIRGYKKTKLYIIEREIPFKSGDYILRSELKNRIKLCHDQLMNTSLFVDVEVTVAKEDTGLIYIDVNLKERWYLFPLPYFKIIGRNFNEWWVTYHRSLDKINYGLKFMQNNVSGRNDNLNIWLINGYTQQASIRYENPFLDKSLKNGINLGFSYSRNREINYANFADTLLTLKRDYFLTRQIHADISYTYRPAIKTRHNFRISYNDEQVHDSVIMRNPKFFPNGASGVRYIDFSYSIQYFSVDYIPYPLKGFMGDAYVYKRGLGSKNNILQFGGKGTYSLTVLPKSYLQLQASGLIKFPFRQPYFAQGLMGSSDLVLRGMEYYVINGAAGGLGRATAKREMLSFSVRNRFSKSPTFNKIPFKVYLKGYGDVGYAYNPDPGNSIFSNKWLHTWGMGVDIVTFYDVVVKLEYSFNQRGESGLFIHTKSDF